MAAQAPDPKAFKTWEDAFQHPLPVVRRMEQQLRSNIDENREKLRTLVGASYRDLLGTADRIIEMDDQMQRVETHLGNIGRNCNTRTIDRVTENNARMKKLRGEKDKDKYTAIAQTRLLQKCMAVASRIIKQREDALLAAKLLVLARLLLHTMSEKSETAALLEGLRLRYSLLRTKLLSYIDYALVRPDAGRPLLVHALCAYALATSSAPVDVLRHFLSIRYQTLEDRTSALEGDEATNAMDLLVRTVQEAQYIFPGRFADAVSELATVPLLQDRQIRSMQELSLDVHERWIADHVRHFIPWVRHDELQPADTSSAIQSWTKQAQECLIGGLEDYVGTKHNLREVLVTRETVVRKLLGTRSNTRIYRYENFLQSLRETFLSRLNNVVVAKVQGISKVTEVLKSMDNEHKVANANIWDLASNDIELDGGALCFRSAISESSHGIDTSIRRMMASFDEWITDIDSAWVVTDEIRATKWEDELDLDIDDISNGESPSAALSQQDSAALQKRVREEVDRAFTHFQNDIQHAAGTTSDPATLIRVLREVGQRKRNVEDRIGAPGSSNGVETLVTKLHEMLAASLYQGLLADYASDMQRDQSVATVLWEGTPPLPVQPSPATFKFLLSLHRAMSAAGGDLWSPSAVVVLKKALRSELAVLFETSISESKEALTNGHSSDLDSSAAGAEASPRSQDDIGNGRKDKLLQVRFDISYLQDVLATSQSSASPNEHFASIAADINKGVGLEVSMDERMMKSTVDYWKRTHLLFGLLAQ